MKNILLFICLVFSLTSCSKGEEAPDSKLPVNIGVKGGEIILLDPETGKPLQATPCVTTEKGKGRVPKCAIFDDEFKTLAVIQATIILSEKKTGSVTCSYTTISSQAGIKEYIRHFPDLNACPGDWIEVEP